MNKAPQILQSMMGNIFEDLYRCHLYDIDNILTFSKTVEQHKDNALAIIKDVLIMLLFLEKISACMLLSKK